VEVSLEDAEEENQQVALMKDIYTSAKQVVIWLGLDEEEAAPEVFRNVKILLKSPEEFIDNCIDINNARGLLCPDFAFVAQENTPFHMTACNKSLGSTRDRAHRSSHLSPTGVS
jgi:hypothetical protein